MKRRNKKGQFKQESALTLFRTRPVFAFGWAFGLPAIIIIINSIYMHGQIVRNQVVERKEQEVVVIEPIETKIVQAQAEFAVVPTVTDNCVLSIDKGLEKYGKTAFNGKGHLFVESAREVSKKVGNNPNDSEICESAKWAVAIGLTESGGRHESGRFNYWGLKDFRTGKWEDFTDIDNAIYTYIYRTYRPYLQHNNHTAYTGKYCQSSCINWQKNVNYFLNLLNY